MSGYPEFNFPAFFAAEEKLQAEGWDASNPAKKDLEKTLDPKSLKTGNAELAIKKGFDFREAFTWDVNRVIKGDAIYMLRGWEFSPGASAEHAVAVAMKRHYPEYRIIY